MVVTAWLFIFCLFATEAWGKEEFFYHWREKFLKTKVSVRLVKKNWQPSGPVIQGDEYELGLDTAFRSLKKSSYEYESVDLEQSDKLFQSDQYDKTKDSIVLIPPAMANADVPYINASITALAMRNLHREYNVFAVNMPLLNFNILLSLFKNMLFFPTKYENIAEVICQFMVKAINNKYLTPSQIHLVGYSYSGQLVGYVARYIYLLYEQKVNTIVSLDPYTNSYNRHLVHLSKEDAQVVHIYHSNSALSGTRERMGTADFTFNSGHHLPECGGWEVVKSVVPFPNICSHRRIAQRWWYIILYSSKFVARKCDSWNRLIACDCDKNDKTQMSYPIKNREVTGTYFLRTGEVKPYGLGDSGAECSHENRQSLVNRKTAERAKHNVPDLNELFGGRTANSKNQ